MRNESVFRLGSNLACGFSCRPANQKGDQWGARDIVDRCYILVYILQGCGRYSDVNGNDFEIRPGVLYQRFPGTCHSNVFEASEGFFECYAVLPRQIFEVLLESGAISMKRSCLQIGVSKDIYARFEGFFKELQNQSENRLHLTLAAMHSFAAELLSMEPIASYEEACTLLEAKLDGKLSMPSVARKLGMSYSKFRQVFSLRMGSSPCEYRIKKRMELAQRLLASDVITIKEVARETGYPDVYSFSKQFRLHSGLAPAQFVKTRRRGL